MADQRTERTAAGEQDGEPDEGDRLEYLELAKRTAEATAEHAAEQAKYVAEHAAGTKQAAHHADEEFEVPAPRTVGRPQVPLRAGRKSADRATVRLSADLPGRDADTLAELAKITGFNKVTTLVRAIRVLAELIHAEDDNGELVITYKDGRRERLILR